MTEVVTVRDIAKRFVVHKDKSLKERVVNARTSRAQKVDFWALQDINLDIHSGETIGLVGANGSGKSTLLKVIGGILTPDRGEVMLRGRLAALLELGAGFHPDLTGRENVYLNAAILGLTEAETQRHFDEIVAFSGIEDFIDTQVKFYSSGMYVRLAFAVAVHVDPDILLVDEVLAVGDEPFQHKCMEKIHEFQDDGRTIILVSHSASQVAEVCDRAVMLEHGRIVVDGSTDEVLGRLRHNYEVTIEAEEMAEAERKGEVSLVLPADQQITSTEIVAPVVDGVPTIAPGDDLVVRGGIKAAPPLIGWGISLTVSTVLGGAVLGTDTKMMGAELPVVDGEGEFELVLPRLQLGEGEYAISLSLLDGNLEEIHRIREAGRFKVHTDGHTVGAVYTDPRLIVSG
ncbi:ABC transporter ATP-binding protein [Actinomyces haliotis]|uniref:ABC transporter ATP-binding protein n=1 Tax=Actinomyces haliotis TaxID=1280843 RepID=UPI00188EA76D|nr:ABC transporter ATP-binding protein [Actinomyces haliotis]